MKIYVVDFREGTSTAVQHQYNPASLDLEFVDLKYLQDIQLRGTVDCGIETLVFRGDLSSEVERICGRCLKAVKEKIKQPFELVYETKGIDEIDATNDLRETLILSHPLTFVCRENCKGLCPNCGINLNESQCQCDADSKGGSFSSLQEFWAKKKKEERKNG